MLYDIIKELNLSYTVKRYFESANYRVKCGSVDAVTDASTFTEVALRPTASHDVSIIVNDYNMCYKLR